MWGLDGGLLGVGVGVLGRACHTAEALPTGFPNLGGAEAWRACLWTSEILMRPVRVCTCSLLCQLPGPLRHLPSGGEDWGL